MREIFFIDYPSFRQEVTLDGTPYIFETSWNSRGSFWTLTIYDREENILIGGIKLVLNYEMLLIHPDRGLPPGTLMVLDYSGRTDPIEQDDFVGSRRLQFTYLTEDDLAAI